MLIMKPFLLLTVVITLKYAVGYQLKMRVDDELQLWLDGVEKVNAFNIPGWQWTTVWTINYDSACMLAVRMFNQGVPARLNPGEAISTIDGKDISGAGWRCKAYSGGNPDSVFPGWKSCNYDDSAWGPNVLIQNPVKGPTPGMNSAAKWWWGAQQSEKNVVCRLRMGHELKCRVDDELRLLVDGDERVNAFKTPGWQWTTVYTTTIKPDDCMLAVQMYNQGGPGEAICTVDGKDISGADWHCEGFNDGGNPDQIFPGWQKCGFDDCHWHGNVLRPQSSKGRTAGMNAATWWWGASQKTQNVVCRLRLSSKLKIRVDDDVAAWVDGKKILDTFVIPGFQWLDVFDRIIPFGTKVLVIKVYNQGGPGEILCTINSKDCSQKRWKCAAIGANQDPQAKYPGIHDEGFNDSRWDNIVLRPNSSKAKQGTKGFDSSIVWWWGGQQSRTYAVCRLVLHEH